MSYGLIALEGDRLRVRVIRLRDNQVRLSGTFVRETLKMTLGI